MQTRGNVYAKLLFDAAGARKRWLGNWSIVVQGVTDGLDLLHHKTLPLDMQSAEVDSESERKEMSLKCKEWSRGGGTSKGEAKTRSRRRTRGGVHF